MIQTRYKNTLKGYIIFEIKSFIARNFLCRKLPKKKGDKIYLHLGCGTNYKDGFINADLIFSLKFWKRKTDKVDWIVDLRYPLPCDDEYFDGIFTEHTIEHLYPEDAINLLRECYRILKKNGIIRITVPDLDRYIDFCKNSLAVPEDFRKKYKYCAEAIHHLAQDNYHLSVWNFELLKDSLEYVGFRKVLKCNFGEGLNKDLILDIEERKFETLYVEAIK